jgi:hypothetical protein
MGRHGLAGALIAVASLGTVAVFFFLVLKDAPSSSGKRRESPDTTFGCVLSDSSGKALTFQPMSMHDGGWALVSSGSSIEWRPVSVSQDPVKAADTTWFRGRVLGSESVSLGTVLLDDNGHVVVCPQGTDSFTLVCDKGGAPIWRRVPIGEAKVSGSDGAWLQGRIHCPLGTGSNANDAAADQAPD